jgi:hypothetical protein
MIEYERRQTSALESIDKTLKAMLEQMRVKQVSPDCDMLAIYRSLQRLTPDELADLVIEKLREQHEPR